MNFQIRKIESDDLNEIGVIERLSSNNPWSDETLKKAILNPNAINLLLVFEEKITGFLFSCIISDECELHNIAIHPDYRGKGFSKLLIQSFFELLKGKKIANIYLEVRQNNLTAINLYQKTGFSEYSMRKNYYSDGCNAILMRKVV
ncbi:MAG: hypothetical protein ACD_79C00967G0007 [uncultured bacterium]|nr:MAG: hypothetical protein ACD_79C00967G0007 [uncultured bacterium]